MDYVKDGPNVYMIDMNCGDCDKFNRWLQKCWDASAPRKRKKTS